jgi:hypothetical protein
MTQGTTAKHSVSKRMSTTNIRSTPVNELLSQEERTPILSHAPGITGRTSSQSASNNSSTGVTETGSVDRQTIEFYLQEALDLPDVSDHEYEYNFDMSESTDATDDSSLTEGIVPVDRETIEYYLQKALDLPDVSDYEYNFDMSGSTDATDSSRCTD